MMSKVAPVGVEDQTAVTKDQLNVYSRPRRSKSPLPSSTNLQPPVDIATVPSKDIGNQVTESENSIAKWIHTKGRIKKRECYKYVFNSEPRIMEKQAKNRKDPLCCCGAKRSEHKNTEGDNSHWNDNNTVVSSTDAFGEVQFIGYGMKLAKYIRVDHNQDMKSMLELMTTQWKLQVPDLIISVTGGAKNFHMKPRLKEVFRRGLMKAAESTGAWIITGGMHAGVMKHVGEAVRDYTVAHGNKSKVVALGIAPWGCVNNRDSLCSDALMDNKYPMGLWPAQYKADTKERKTSPIDPNHSHFILVDNGTSNMFATEIDFRAKLETAVSNYHKTHRKHSGGAKTIPSVCVVLEGGPGTLKTVKSAIESGTPAVIVEGSGRAADILAYAYAHSGEEKVEVQDKLKRTITKTVSVMEDKVWTEVEKQIQEEFGTKNIDKNIHMVRECLKKRDHITVFRLDGTYSAKDIDMAILQALLKTNQDVVIDQLKLALAWNRIDIAKTEIFTDNIKFQPEDLHEVMYEAILNNKPDFVSLFVANGVDLGEFLTVQRLLQLYNNVPHKELLYQILRRQKRSKEAFTLEDVTQLISLLMGDFYHPLYNRKANYRNAKLCDENQGDMADDTTSQDDLDILIMKDDKIPNDMAVPLWIAPFKQPAVDTHSVMSQYSQYQRDLNSEACEDEFDEPARELFIWSILMNRQELAFIFWEEGQELGIAAALLSQKLLQGMMSHSTDSELNRELKAGAQHAGDVAIGVLSECYSIDEKKCHMMLVRNLPLYGNSTIVELAVQADNKTFIGHAACQSLFNKIWSGRMSEHNGELKLWVSIFCTPLIPFIIKFRNDDSFALESKNKPKALTDKEDPSFLEREGTLVNGVVNNNKETFQNSHGKHKKYLSDENPFSRGYPFWKKIIHFYNSPIVIFRCNCISVIMYLLLYSMVILTDFSQGIFTIKEWVLITWTITLLMEEIRQVANEEASKWYLKVGSYISDHWNKLDVITLALFTVGEILHAIDNFTCYEISRIILALTLMTFCFRLLHIFSVHKELGPKLVMIGRMMVDLMYFVVILLVFVGAYGVAIQAIRYPNATLDITLIMNIFEKAYFQIFGELFLEDLKGEVECSNDPDVYDNGTLGRCPSSTSTWLVPIILGVYIMITNVLMLNLLIALFSYTFSAIQDNTDKHWAFQRYYLTKEFHDRPALAPPLIFFSHIFLMTRNCCQYCCQKFGNVENAFTKHFPDSDVKQLVLWERMNSDEYIRRTEAEEAEKIENQVKTTNERVDGIAKQVDEMMENSFLMQSAETAVTAPIKLPPALDDRLDFLQQQLDRTSKAVDWIIDSLANMGPKKDKPNLKSVQQIRQEARDNRDKERESKKKTLKDMLQKQLELHQQSRQNSYPTTDKSSPKYRADVPDEKVPWEEEFKDYMPMEFTDSWVINKAKQGTQYADIDLMRQQPEDRKKLIYNWNMFDVECGINRATSVMNSQGQPKYKVVDGLPLNPCGRTGMCGRGMLYRYGPNHAGDPIVTRWKTDNQNRLVKEGGKKVLEFISIQRSDNKEWAIPGGFLDDEKKTVPQCLKIELIQEGLGGNIPMGVDLDNLEKLWETGVEVYKGYADDPRNTDNAWIETVAINYHDEDGSLTENLALQAGEGTDLVRWQTLNTKQALYSVHLSILCKLAKMKNAFF